MRRARSLLLALVALAAPANAHDGPPFPILVGQDFAGREVDIWADPDVGVGTFYVYLEARDGDVEHLGMWVSPADGRLAEVFHRARSADPGQPYQYIIEADFDRRGDWNCRFTFDGAGSESELLSLVPVTPPGIGRIDVLWFLSPFLAIAFLWGKAMRQRAKYARSQATLVSHQ